MTFKDGEWEERVQVLGDPAEVRFKEWAAARGLGCVKFGLDRPPVDLRRITAFVRYAPDFLTDEGLMEVQGCGRDMVLKFKHDKLVALRQWNRMQHVSVWLWNQPLDDWRMLTVPRLDAMCRQPSYTGRHVVYRSDGTFDGTKPYAAVPWIDLI